MDAMKQDSRSDWQMPEKNGSSLLDSIGQCVNLGAKS
jgi:hypothetical protein